MSNKRLKPPSWLREPAKSIFRMTMAEYLQNHNEVTTTEIEMVARYSTLRSTSLSLTRFLDKHGTTYETIVNSERRIVEYPQLRQRNQINNELIKLERELGFTTKSKLSLFGNPDGLEMEVSDEEKLLREIDRGASV
jgi:P27 family predicted phage terminase small subunit